SRKWWQDWAATLIGSRRHSIQSQAPMPVDTITIIMMTNVHRARKPPPPPNPLPHGERGPLYLLRLLTWLSPTFPTGAYAYSHGLEWVVECGDITDGDSLRVWLTDVLTHGSGRNDAILLRHAHRDRADHVALNELAMAIAPSRERRTETLDQGTAFIAAAWSW